MSKILKIVKKYFGEILLVIGTGTFWYNIFNFSFSDSSGPRLNLLGLPSLGSGRDLGNVAYYYTDSTLLLITVGAMLIVIGVLIIRKFEK